jgi:hypothetical protein
MDMPLLDPDLKAQEDFTLQEEGSLEAAAKPVLSWCQVTVLTVPNRCLQDRGFSR